MRQLSDGDGSLRMDLLELRYQAVQCHVRAKRAAHDDDAEWLLDLAMKLNRLADSWDDRAVHRACRELSSVA